MNTIRLTVILLLVLGSFVSQAQETVDGPSLDISLEFINLDNLRNAINQPFKHSVLRMNLQECIQLALEQNNDILIAAIEPMKSDADIQSARGEFDPTLTGQHAFFNSSETTVQPLGFDFTVGGGLSLIEGETTSKSYRSAVQTALLGRLHYGTQYTIALNANRSRTSFGDFEPNVDTSLSLTLTQPLLRGFGKQVNTVRIRAAKNMRQISAAQLNLTVMNAVAEVVKAYWDLVGAVENLEVQKSSLENAERLLKINMTRREIGTAADIEVIQAQAGVATRQGEVIRARSLIGDTSDRLKQILDLSDEGRLSRVQIVPTERPNPGDTSTFDADAYEASTQQSIELALLHRPEVSMTDLEIENARLEQLRSRNNMLPDISLTGSYRQGGQSDDYNESLTNLRDRQNELYSYGLQASIPIGNRAARGAYRRSKFVLRQAEKRQHQTRQNLILAVNLAARSVITNNILVESSQQARRLQQAIFVAEEKRLRLGVTTSWQVLQIQNDLTTAELQVLQAEIAHEKAVVELQLAEGMLLKNMNIEFDVANGETAPGYFDSLVPRRAAFRPHWE
jgi:outer membrane protein TolC